MAAGQESKPQIVEKLMREITKSRTGERELQLPEVIIYRRTKKTGSSSMLAQLLKMLDGKGYTALYHERHQLRAAVRGENSATWPKKLFIATHNDISRNDTGGRRTVIIDTVLDGYRQVTSFCRFGKHVEKCDAELVKCLEGRSALNQQHYRWAGRTWEDASTYIDIPLSSAHPALSTTAIRRIFANATLDVGRLNAVGSGCGEVPALRETYNRLYTKLDLQVDLLRARLLVLTGYPLLVTKGDVSMAELLDRAEMLEREKYQHQFGVVSAETSGISAGHRALRAGERAWAKGEDGLIRLQGAHE